jgi:hypothetical protein
MLGAAVPTRCKPKGYCTTDEKLWTSWRVQPATHEVCGPGKLFEGIALPNSY